MRAAIAIALKDLRLRLRDRSFLIVGFVAPLGLAFIVTSAFGSGFTGNFHASFGVVDEDGGPLAKAFTEQVLGAPRLREQFDVQKVGSADEARRLIRGGRDGLIDSAFYIPRGFSAAVTNSQRSTITVLRNPNTPVASEVAEAIAHAYVDQVNASRLAILTAIRVGGSRVARPSEGPGEPRAVAELARAAANERIPVRLVDDAVGVREVSGANYFGPSMAIFFLFFTTSFAARSLLSEREQGTLTRVLAAPISHASVLAGKGIVGFITGAASLAVMFTVFGLAPKLKVEWGDPLAIAALCAVTILAVMGLAAVVQTFARTHEQADSYSSMAAVTLSLLGGNFFPLFQMPQAIQRASLATPNGWALRGFMDISYDGAKLVDIGPHIAVIGAFALVTCGLAVIRARKMSAR
jgi:ABC-2 type transport system permease protein